MRRELKLMKNILYSLGPKLLKNQVNTYSFTILDSDNIFWISNLTNKATSFRPNTGLVRSIAVASPDSS